MVGFLESVGASFLGRSPSGVDRSAAGAVDVQIGRKLLESLVEVGLREAFADMFTLRRLELVTLHTQQNRRAKVVAHVAANKIVDVDLTLEATIELREPIGDGLRLFFHAISAEGRGGVLDWLAANIAHWAALNDLAGTEVTIDSVKLRGAAVRRLHISGEDPVRVVVELKNADMGSIF